MTSSSEMNRSNSISNLIGILRIQCCTRMKKENQWNRYESICGNCKLLSSRPQVRFAMPSSVEEGKEISCCHTANYTHFHPSRCLNFSFNIASTEYSVHFSNIFSTWFIHLAAIRLMSVFCFFCVEFLFCSNFGCHFSVRPHRPQHVGAVLVVVVVVVVIVQSLFACYVPRNFADYRLSARLSARFV